MGFEYCYDFCADDGIIPLYDRCLSRVVTSDERRCYLLEIRTNFKINIRFDDKHYPLVVNMGSERFGIVMMEGGNVVERKLESLMSHRLAEYRMLNRQIRWLARAALEFMEKIARGATLVIPVVVELDVWTVQLEGESIDEAVGRAVRPESLYHLRLCNVLLRDEDQYKSDDNVYLNEGKYRGLSCNVSRILTDSDHDEYDFGFSSDSQSDVSSFDSEAQTTDGEELAGDSNYNYSISEYECTQTLQVWI